MTLADALNEASVDIRSLTASLSDVSRAAGDLTIAGRMGVTARTTIVTSATDAERMLTGGGDTPWWLQRLFDRAADEATGRIPGRTALDAIHSPNVRRIALLSAWLEEQNSMISAIPE